MRINYVLDCAEPDRLADFWAAALGFERHGSGGPYVSLRRPGTGQPELLLQQVPEPKQVKNRMHPDLRVQDGEAEVGRLVALGATVLEAPHDDEGHWTTVLADPEGNEFCVIVSPEGWLSPGVVIPRGAVIPRGDDPPYPPARFAPRWGADRSTGRSPGQRPGLAGPVRSSRRYCCFMFAVSAVRIDAEDPLHGLELGERPDPKVPDGWTTVSVRAAALNHHDLFTLRGVGIKADQLPMVLGCDAAGVDEDGNDVVVHSVIGDPDAGGGDETLDPRRSLLSERYDGTFAEKVTVPRRNVLPKPAALSFEQAACLPTAYLTAYRMLFTKSGVQPGSTILVQGAGGGVATALITLGRAAGFRMWVTSRSEDKRQLALDLGADQAFETGARLPERVDVVMESVGEATWGHSVKSLKPGGRIVICGATSGHMPPAELQRIFFLQLSVVGSTMGTRAELGRLLEFCEQSGARPLIGMRLPLREAREGFAAMALGEQFGKIVFTVG